MNSKKLFYVSVATCAVCFSVVAIQATVKSPSISLLKSSSGTDGHVLSLDNSDTPVSITDTYQNNVSGTVKTSNDNDVTLNFVNAKKTGSEFVTLANHGKIYTFGEDQEHQITAVNGISFTGSGSLLFKPCSYKNVLAELDPIVVNAGSASISIPSCDTFEIEAGDSGAVINQLTFNYDCNPEAYDASLLTGTYTGMGSGYTYKLTINSDATATLETLDKDTNDLFSGSISMSSKTSITFTGSSKTYNMTTNGYQLIGSAQSGIPAIMFDRVYKVEDFESYSASGQGYTNATTKYETTGLRSQYYADYYTGSSSGEIGGSGWPVMTSSDNTTYTSDKGHNGSAAGVFKLSKGTQMRYISMNELYGVKRMIGKGTTLSFWSRCPYTTKDLSANHPASIPIKVYAYYASPLTSSNQTTVREVADFTVLNIETWQHFEMPLTAGREYLGFGIYAQQSTSATAYLPFDDFEIYTASPYAIADYPEGTFKGSATVLGSSYSIVLAIGNQNNKLVAVSLANSDAVATGITYNPATKQITIPTTGDYKGYSYGTISGTYDKTNNRITGLACSGSISSHVSNNGSITANKAKSADGFFNDCDGSTSSLQSTFKRRYMSGSWQVDTGNSDRITSNTIEYVCGTGSLKRRGYSGGAVALNLNSDISSTPKLKNIHFWVYNPSNSDITLRMWVYPATNLNSGDEMGSVTAKANGWTYCAMGFNSAVNTYNFQIADFGNSGTYLSFDNIYVFA